MKPRRVSAIGDPSMPTKRLLQDRHLGTDCILKQIVFVRDTCFVSLQAYEISDLFREFGVMEQVDNKRR